jgi:hypothetical protein
LLWGILFESGMFAQVLYFNARKDKKSFDINIYLWEKYYKKA